MDGLLGKPHKKAKKEWLHRKNRLWSAVDALTISVSHFSVIVLRRSRCTQKAKVREYSLRNLLTPGLFSGMTGMMLSSLSDFLATAKSANLGFKSTWDLAYCVVCSCIDCYMPPPVATRDGHSLFGLLLLVLVELKVASLLWSHVVSDWHFLAVFGASF